MPCMLNFSHKTAVEQVKRNHHTVLPYKLPNMSTDLRVCPTTNKITQNTFSTSTNSQQHSKAGNVLWSAFHKNWNYEQNTALIGYPKKINSSHIICMKPFKQRGRSFAEAPQNSVGKERPRGGFGLEWKREEQKPWSDSSSFHFQPHRLCRSAHKQAPPFL